VQVQFPDGKNCWVPVSPASGSGDRRQEVIDFATLPTSVLPGVSFPSSVPVSMHESPVGPGTAGDSQLATPSGGQKGLPGVTGRSLNPTITAADRHRLPSRKVCTFDRERSFVEAKRPDPVDPRVSVDLGVLANDGSELIQALVSALVPAISGAFRGLASGGVPTSTSGTTSGFERPSAASNAACSLPAPVPGCSWWSPSASPPHRVSRSGSPAGSRAGSTVVLEEEDDGMVAADSDDSPAGKHWEEGSSAVAGER